MGNQSMKGWSPGLAGEEENDFTVSLPVGVFRFLERIAATTKQTFCIEALSDAALDPVTVNCSGNLLKMMSKSAQRYWNEAFHFQK
jgi:hypothetical protein